MIVIIYRAAFFPLRCREGRYIFSSLQLFLMSYFIIEPRNRYDTERRRSCRGHVSRQYHFSADIFTNNSPDKGNAFCPPGNSLSITSHVLHCYKSYTTTDNWAFEYGYGALETALTHLKVISRYIKIHQTFHGFILIRKKLLIIWSVLFWFSIFRYFEKNVHTVH